MRITVFGASGRTGHLFMDKALQGGHEIVAFARSPEKITIHDDRLSIVQGIVSDTKLIERAVHGADAVIELMGAVSEGTANIVSAMVKHRIKRLVAVSAISLPDSRDQWDLRRMLMNGLVHVTIPRHVKEVRKAASIVRASNLDWTLVRVPYLRDREGEHVLRTGSYGRGEVDFQLTRKALAAFMYEQLTREQFIHKAPAISS